MFRILIILGITLYILSKIGSFFFKVGAASQQRHQPRKPSEGSINVDSMPKKDKKSSTIKGGDYIDYEEVK